ncbi:MAG: EAL domain-containing protein [Clostridia bacterium]|nr:EAL domain-containing protein [Clostridia bacterium]
MGQVNSEILKRFKTVLDDVVLNKSIDVFYQPIISLVDGSTIGYEALCRGPKNCLVRNSGALFQAAASSEKLHEVEYLCKCKILERSTDISKNHFIFTNIETVLVEDESFHNNYLSEIQKHFKDINPSRIVFEIKENSIIEEYSQFFKGVQRLTSLGCRIAADRVGGRSGGMRMLTDKDIEFIKLDLSLVKGVCESTEKQALIKLLCDFCSQTGKKLIAVGIENEEDLKALIELGVHMGQGYLFGKPSDTPCEASQSMKELIAKANSNPMISTISNKNSTVAIIGEVCTECMSISPETMGEEAAEIFKRNENLQGLPVVEGKRVVGLLVKESFLAKLATQYGVSLFMKRPVKLLMDSEPMVVDFNEPFYDVARSAAARINSRLYDYIIITKDEEYVGIATVKDILEKSTSLEVNQAKYINSFSGLPGKELADSVLADLARRNAPFSVISVSLENFGAFGKCYGTENADNAVLMLKSIIIKSLGRHHYENAFVGHLGKDEFIIVIDKCTRDDSICLEIQKEFSQSIAELYKKSEKQLQPSENISLSLFAINNEGRRFESKYHIYDELYKSKWENSGKIKEGCA